MAVTSAVLLTVGAVLNSTWSGFTETTDNPGNTFSTATVSLEDNDGGSTPMFSAATSADNAYGLVPGQTVSQCIAVTYTSTARTGTPTVTMHGAGTTGGLGSHLDMTITRGTVAGTVAFPATGCGTGFTPDSVGQVYTGTIDGFLTAYTGVGTSTLDTGGWTNSSTGVTRYFQVSITPRATASAGQSLNAVSFVWQSDTN